MNREIKLKLAKYSLKSLIVNLVGLLIVNHFFGFNIAVLVGIATLISTIDEFGYTYMEGTK